MSKTEYSAPDVVDKHQCSWTTTSKRFIDLTGKTFGNLNVIKLHKRETPHTFWFCQCSCGNIVSLSTNNLNSKRTSCKACSFSEMGSRMMNGKDYYLAKVKEIHPDLLCINSISGQSQDLWLWYCESCDTEFEAKPSNITSCPERKSCRCTNNFKGWTQEMREGQILERCSQHNTAFLGWVGKYEDNKSRIKLRCLKDTSHEEWESNINNFLRKDIHYGCPECGVSKRADSNRRTLVEFKKEAIAVHGNKYSYDKYDYIDSRTPSSITCNECKHEFKQSHDNHVNKRKNCPSCAGNNQQQCYIFQVKDKVTIVAVKAGIAVEYLARLKRQNSKSLYDVSLFGVWDMPSIQLCKDAERSVKRTLPCGYLTQREYPDGFTETVSTVYVEDIIKIYEQYGGARRENYE